MRRFIIGLALISAFLAAAAGSAIAASDAALKAAQQGDFATAHAIWSREANEGDPEAAFYLGYMYEKGDGVKRNLKTALKWYAKSANAGYAEAQFHIGYMYAQGIGVRKDLRKSVIWTGMAVRQGHAKAKSNLVETQEYLASCYFSGCPKDGIKKDEVKSYVWHSIAAKNGSSFSRNMTEGVGMLLSPADLKRAKELARECERTGYASCG